LDYSDDQTTPFCSEDAHAGGIGNNNSAVTAALAQISMFGGVNAERSSVGKRRWRNRRLFIAAATASDCIAAYVCIVLL
jgi:hypothetical protein